MTNEETCEIYGFKDIFTMRVKCEGIYEICHMRSLERGAVHTASIKLYFQQLRQTLFMARQC